MMMVHERFIWVRFILFIFLAYKLLIWCMFNRIFMTPVIYLSTVMREMNSQVVVLQRVWIMYVHFMYAPIMEHYANWPFLPWPISDMIQLIRRINENVSGHIPRWIFISSNNNFHDKYNANKYCNFIYSMC